MWSQYRSGQDRRQEITGGGGGKEEGMEMEEEMAACEGPMRYCNGMAI
jgi:hypothetical protein